jgi:hypothetical protein
MTPKQQMWSNIFKCAVERSSYYLELGDVERLQREHTTITLALQKGDGFWQELL